MRAGWRLLIGQAVIVLLAVSLPWIVLSPFPGALKATAPLLCPDDQPDARIVEYHTDTGDGTGTSWTLVCLGPAGDLSEVGTWRPVAVFLGAWLLALEALVLPAQLLGLVRRRRRHRRGPTGPSGPSGPTDPPPSVPPQHRVPVGLPVDG